MSIANHPSIKQVFDQREFRNALGTFTTGVTIVTACQPDGKLVGVTVNSFNSVSLEPPLVLWSLAKSSNSLPAFQQAEHWAVHILSHNQDQLATHFGKRGQDKFAGLQIEHGLGNVPLLAGCTTRMQCKTAYRYDGGDHIIMVGEVMLFEHTDTPPLVYQRGNYAIATRKELADEAEALIKASASSTSSDENSLSYLLGTAYFQMYGKLRAFGAQLGLNDIEFFVLNTLAAHQGRSLEELTRLFVYAGHAPLIHVLDDMVARGLLQVVVDKGDANERGLFYLTELGQELAQQIADAGRQCEADMMASLGKVDAIALHTLLRRFINLPGCEKLGE